MPTRFPRTFSRIACFAYLALGLGFVQCKPSSPAIDAAADSAIAIDAGVSDAGEAGANDEIKATYEDGPAHPLAERYCDAVVDHPAQRRAVCCKGSPTTVRPMCVRNLSAALRVKAITVDEAALATCAEDVKKAHEGCDWPGPLEPPVPASCARVLGGTLARGATCRSSLECSGTMFCRGAGPTEQGKCSDALADGERCHLGVDALGAFVFQMEHIERGKPECQGACAINTCIPRRAAGKPCRTTQECEASLYCVKGTCTAATPGKEGEPCAGNACADGHHCNAGTCTKKRAAGEACTTAFDCAVGGCVKSVGAKTGKCGMKCSSL